DRPDRDPDEHGREGQQDDRRDLRADPADRRSRGPRELAHSMRLYGTYRSGHKRKRRGRMVARKLMLGQLASVGEGAIGKLAQNPVTHRALEGAMQVKERVEKLVNGLESLEQRMTAVEQRLDALEKPKRRATTTKSTTAAKTTASKTSAKKT